MSGKAVVVGGGTGFIGRHLERLLTNKGYEVKIVTRTPKLTNHINWEDVRAAGLPANTSAVVNLAGQNILDMKRQWTTKFRKLVWDSRIETTKTLAKSIEGAHGKIQSFTVMSGVGIYPSDRNVHDEQEHVSEFDFLSKMCIELENVSKVSSELNCRNIIIRSGVVLGKEGGMIKQLYLPFRLGLGGVMGSGKQILPWIHVDDLAQLIVFGIEKDNVKGIFNGVAPAETTNEEFTKALAGALHKPAFIPMPEAVLKVMFQERHKMITTGPIVRPGRAISLGFKYTYPEIKEACQSFFNEPKPPAF